MKVKELIALLQKADPENEVEISAFGRRDEESVQKVDTVASYDNGKTCIICELD